ncbi:Adenine/guanine phosphoribosyltransferase [Devosia enhydra]|uniref:Adenine/guanine phosphoribosyltransferase n=1 Tax=Devosia enhydra TaxID=665118 RepID=A0A1K2I2B4_9HYPH|nr:phosphoribosyltransferase [Devosia enhydra]SFZ86472.1 Adenine/guanine phosphoribosyltransferase [Devosia enhydra]
MPRLPHAFWQEILPADGTPAEASGLIDAYPARLPDGRVLELPIRVLPGDGSRAVASLILNQASFAVEDALAEALTAQVAEFAPDIVVGVPTLGLPLAANVARRLGHPRFVALGTSRKFWYDASLSEPMASITSPDHTRTLYLDPRMLPLLEGRRVALIDDVISTASSIGAVLRLLAKAGIAPVAIGCAMLQSQRWRAPLAAQLPVIRSAIASPLLEKGADVLWHPLLEKDTP